MNLLKKNLALLLAAALCLSLAACGGDNDVDVVGDDWRVTGVVCAGGTITRGDGDVDVLVTMDDNGASFYWDDPDHTLFDSVDFPFTIPNARECFNEISFADLTANGESDVEISFATDSGMTYLTWLWDPEGYYVFRGDLSTYTIDGADLSEYTGLWQWEGESLWLCIYDDETWAMFDDQENMVQAGSLWLSETGIVLYFYDTGDVVPLDVTVRGDLVNIENDLMFVPADSVPANNDVDLSEYIGLWEYVGENLWICIYDDDTWSFFNDQEDVIANGTLAADEYGITLFFDGSGDEMRLDFAVSGDLLDVENNGTLGRAGSIQSTVPYFTRYGLEINALVDAGTYWMEDGFGSFSGGDQFHSKGEGYTPGDCYWEVIKYYDDTYNGIREIKFDAICYVPYSSLGDIDEDYKCSIRHQLYDFYTGKWFTRIDEYKTSTRGKDYYVHTVDWNGQSGIIEFTRSHDWQRDVGEWTTVMTASYHIYMPEWYDGLVLATEPLPDNYEDFARFDSQHRAFAEASIMDINLLDPYGCLFFNICD